MPKMPIAPQSALTPFHVHTHPTHGHALRLLQAFMLGLSLVLVLAVTTGLARADGNHIIVDEKTIKDAGTVSGWPSHGHNDVRQPGNGAILYGIGGSEEGDNPCYIELLWSRQNASEHRLFTAEWHRGPCGAKRTKSHDETRLALAPPQSAIRAIKVCTNKKDNRKLKGVAITSASEITEYAGKWITVPKITGEYENANCAEWHKASACPTAHVAVGLKIYHDEDGASGLELICGSAGLDPQLDDVVFTEKIKEGEQLLSPVAGTAGTKLRVLIGDGVKLPNDPLRHYGITSVLITEDDDKPCQVALYGGVLDPLKGPQGRLLGEGRLSKCMHFNIGDLVNPLAIGQGTKIHMLLPSVGHLQDHFVNGVQVCDSKTNKNERIKGLGLHPVRVDKNGVVHLWKPPGLPIPAKSKDRHTNRGDFGTTAKTEPKYCPEPDRMIGVGVVMHYEGKSFTGMQLVCRRVTAGKTDPLTKDADGY